MSYNEEQTRQYNLMLSSFDIFNKIKKELSKNKCQTHNKKLKMEANWENEYDVDILISKYCCIDFALQIAKVFIDEGCFVSVMLEKE
ncbi:MAG TPA: hypothetical protein VK498_16025 [Ferruginibacter sp.]|nr:hypothetical protein [Ferruginibacter sp.]